MKFLIDENICAAVLEFLNNQGHDAKKVPSGIKNGEVINLALKEKRVIITSDVHFSNIMVYPPAKHCGIVRLKVHPPSAIKELSAIKNLLSKVRSQNVLNKKLIILDETGFRVRE